MESIQKPIQNESFSSKVDDHDEHMSNAEVQELLQKLEKTSADGMILCKYKGFWCQLNVVEPVILCEKYFKARDTDIILTTFVKSGTTWLKALAFSIVNRSRYPLDKSPLLTSNPQKLVPSLEGLIYRNCDINPDLDHFPDPRIFSTHVHYKSLPSSIIESKCRLIHLCRNPLDQFISLWHFRNMIEVNSSTGPVSLDDFLESYCEGKHFYGPFWEIVLGYWNAHLKNPNKVLFLKFEDLKKDVNLNIKKIAEFIGLPFSVEEEKAGLIEEIAKLCSFDKLASLEVNKVGIYNHKIKNSQFFRRGEVGDWTNYLTPSMVQRIEKVVEDKFRGSGLKFELRA